jgi:hypothetical protein
LRAEPEVDLRAEPEADLRAEPVVDLRAEPVADLRAEPVADLRAEPDDDLRAPEPDADLRAPALFFADADFVADFFADAPRLLATPLLFLPADAERFFDEEPPSASIAFLSGEARSDFAYATS